MTQEGQEDVIKWMVNIVRSSKQWVCPEATSCVPMSASLLEDTDMDLACVYGDIDMDLGLI